MVHCILDADFTPELYLDEALDKSVFYDSLLLNIDKDTNKKLFLSIDHLRQNQTVLSNITHAIYLLPWASQTNFNTTPNNQPNTSVTKQKDRSKALKKGLLSYINLSKQKSLLSQSLLSLRLTGYCCVRDLIFSKLRFLHRSKCRFGVICRIGKAVVKYWGTLLLFDRRLNFLMLSSDNSTKPEIEAGRNLIYVSSSIVLAIVL